MRQTREAELRARLGWEIKEAQLKRKAAIEEAGSTGSAPERSNFRPAPDR